MDYRRMYHIMLDGAEKALEALEASNFGLAKEILIDAEEKAEEIYLQTEEAKTPSNELILFLNVAMSMSNSKTSSSGGRI